MTMTEYERLGGWKGLPSELWGFIEEYTDWDVKTDECAPLYELTTLLEYDMTESRTTEDIITSAIEAEETNYRELQKVAKRVGIKGGQKKAKLIKKIASLVPNYKITQYLKCGEIEVFMDNAVYYEKQRLKEEDKLAKEKKLYDLHIKCGLFPAKAPDGTILYWYKRL